jgi:hypothetical protein
VWPEFQVRAAVFGFLFVDVKVDAGYNIAQKLQASVSVRKDLRRS